MRILKDTYSTLREYQKEGVEFLSSRLSALLADEMGTGKSAQAILSAQSVGADTVLIICPATVKENWKKECTKWGYPEYCIHIIDKKTLSSFTKKLKVMQQGIFIINYDLANKKEYAKVLLSREYDVLICDEAHKLKNKDAMRTKAVYLAGGYAHRSTYKWMLTGTPVLNRPVELYTMLKNLCPERLGSFVNYIAFTARYCNGHEGKWGWDATGHSFVDELSGRLDGFMLRRLKEDVLSELPPRLYQKVYFENDEQVQRLIYEEKHSGTEAEAISIRRKLGTAKVDQTVKWVKDFLEVEDKLILFAYHHDVTDGLMKELSKYNPVKLDGLTPENKRQQAIDIFINNPDCKVFIGQIEAAGQGIDGLQRVCSNAFFVEITHTPGHTMQAVDRLHRIGQDKPVNIFFALMENSIDEDILDNNIFKAELITDLLKDNRIVFDFSGQKQEEIVGIEADLKRIADAAEKIVELMGQRDAGITTIVTAQDSIGIGLTEQPEVKKTKKSKKDESPVSQVNPVVTVTYEDCIAEISNRVSSGVKPEDVGGVYVEIMAGFKEGFPEYESFYDVVDHDVQAKVLEFLHGYLKGKGL
jgi:SWI/SNF-related matrix-associated actin-dependent regulator 1 of chromatin subfamily A